MRICVYGPMRGGKEEPSVFYLGARRLPVVAVVQRWKDESHLFYEVSVEDGRRFVLRHHPETGHWELTAVYRAGPVMPARARTAI